MCWIRFESYIKEVATALFQCKADEILKPDALRKNNKTIRNSVKPKCKAIQEKTKSINELFVQTNGFSSISALKENVFSDIANEAAKVQWLTVPPSSMIGFLTRLWCQLERNANEPFLVGCAVYSAIADVWTGENMSKRHAL